MVRSSSEQLEEGEIVDDDDFEDISDNSIDSTFGKFVSSNENLRALSLSSDSDVEICEHVKHRKKLLPRKCKIKHQKKKKRHRTSSDSSDSDISTCQDLKGKLKEAIRIDEITEGQKNPLKARLKGMWGLTNNENDLAVQDVQEEKPPNVEIQEETDKVDDQELENLRIEALKTAVLNKFQRRRRKKATLEDQKKEVEPLQTLENKENDTPKDELNTVSDNVEKKSVHSPVLDIEEDEDVLRASLLAGLAKKITKIKTNDSVIAIKPTAPILPIQVKSVLPKPPIKNTQVIIKKVVQNRPKPQVKPLIINVNGDSDSEEDIKQKQPAPLSKNKNLNVITNSVEKFLKEQRAKFETETKKRFQIIHKNKNKSILEKSAVKLLPRSQQIEYKQLLLKLKTAEKRKKARKVALQKLKNDKLPEMQKKVEAAFDPSPSVNTEVVIKSFQSQSPLFAEDYSKPVTVDVCTKPLTASEVPTSANGLLQVSQVDVCVKTAVEVISPNENASSVQHSIDKKENDSGKTKLVVTNELTTLQKTLKDIKMQRNGSLQIKSKYQVLTPIIRKITATSNERKKQEQRIKKLLQELNEARTNLAKSHEKFSALVKELVMTKEKVDNSYEDNKRKNGTITKESLGNKHKKTEKCAENEIKCNHSVPVTSTPNKPVISSMPEESSLSSINRNSVNNESEDMDVCSSDETEMCQIDIVDPNDIDQIFTRKSLHKRVIPEYISPLNLNTYERYKNVDPLGIMCPYEVNGSCRDMDCTFKHYLKNNAKLQ